MTQQLPINNGSSSTNTITTQIHCRKVLSSLFIAHKLETNEAHQALIFVCEYMVD